MRHASLRAIARLAGKPMVSVAGEIPFGVPACGASHDVRDELQFGWAEATRFQDGRSSRHQLPTCERCLVLMDAALEKGQ